MKLIVTGSSGFLGTALCAYLEQQGHSLKRLTSANCDLRQADSLQAFSSEKYDMLIHLAAWTQAGDFCIKHPGEQWIINQQINTNVLAWWAAMRRSHQLGEETIRLTREQRRLKSAHTNLQQKSEQLQKLSIHDPLTGTLNRNAFAAELRDRIDHLAQFHRPLNLIVFDLDHFKDINDRSGHLTGDIALKLVVGVVREHLVSDDVFGRFGGDEFLIACADQTLQATGQLAEVIRAAVESRAQTQKPPIPLLTLSIGIAQANEGCGYQPDELFARADAALYEAKRQGRNRVVLADAMLADRADMATADASHRHL